MKKIIFIGLILAFYLGFGNVSEKTNLIPTDAIRIRVLANSNSLEDQEKKHEVKQQLENYLYTKMASAESVEKADNVIKNSLPKLNEIVESTYGKDYTINYGMNYFPKKEYKGVFYEEGYYNSLVVNLGSALGDNWWCILFPPLCMLDGEEMDDVEYRSLIGDIIDRYF